MVPVGTEALQSFFFSLNLIWVDSDDAVAGTENLIHARRGRAGWRRKSRPSHFFSGIYETRNPRHGVIWARGASRREFRGFHESRDTKHETRLFQTRNTVFPWFVWCSLVLKPFSLFFRPERRCRLRVMTPLLGTKNPICNRRGQVGWGQKSRPVAAFLRVAARHGAAMARHGRHGARAAVRAPSAPSAFRVFTKHRDPSNTKHGLFSKHGLFAV